LANFKFGLTGHYKLELFKADGRLVKSLEFENVITNIGKDRLRAGQSISNLYIGTSNAAPAAGNTQMGAFAAAQSVDSAPGSLAAVAGPPVKFERTWTCTFAPGAGTGVLAEVGAGWSATGIGTLFSRSLIKDAGGNPVTLTKLADEYLVLTYTISITLPTTTTGSVTLDGVAYSYTLQVEDTLVTCTLGYLALDASGDYFGGFGAACYNAANTESRATTTTLSSYVSGTYNTTFTAVWGPAAGNLSGGVTKVVLATNFCLLRLTFGAPVPKISTQSMQHAFNITWS